MRNDSTVPTILLGVMALIGWIATIALTATLSAAGDSATRYVLIADGAVQAERLTATECRTYPDNGADVQYCAAMPTGM